MLNNLFMSEKSSTFVSQLKKQKNMYLDDIDMNMVPEEFLQESEKTLDNAASYIRELLTMIGGDETYEARCLDCYELPDSQAELKKSA